MIRKLLLVLAGGFCGAVTRYLLATPLLALAGSLPGAHAGFPYDTLLVNLSGAFLIGLLLGAFEHGAPISPDMRLTLGTGFLGAYTTFSSLMVGAASQLQRGESLVALFYLCGAMCGGVALAFTGFTLAAQLVEWQRMASQSARERALIDGGWEDAAQIDLARAKRRVYDEALAEPLAEPLAELEGRAR